MDFGQELNLLKKLNFEMDLTNHGKGKGISLPPPPPWPLGQKLAGGPAPQCARNLPDLADTVYMRGLACLTQRPTARPSSGNVGEQPGATRTHSGMHDRARGNDMAWLAVTL
jgi:hypothetical protein